MKVSKALKILLGLGLLAVLVYLTGTRELLESLSNITVTSLVVLAIISYLMILLSAIKWRLFLNQQGNSPPLSRLCNLYLVGYFVNLIMPSYLGGDVVRSLYVAQSGAKHEALSATFLERYTGLLAMVVMAVVGACVSLAVTTEIRLIVFGVAAALAIGSYIAFNETALRYLASVSRLERPVGHLRRVQKALRLGLSDPRLLVRAAILSLGFHVLTVINTIAVAYSVGWYDAPALELCIVVPLILLIGAVPISPQGLGIQEGAFFYFLQTVGATPDQAMAVGLVLRAKSYVLAVAGGLVWLGLKHSSSQSKVATTGKSATSCEKGERSDIHSCSE